MKKWLWMFFVSLLTLKAEEVPVYLGTGSDEGIFRVELDSETGELKRFRNVAKMSGPSSLAYSADGIVAVGRMKGAKDGVVASFAKAKDGDLTLIGQQSTMGAGACHVSVDRGSNFVFVANYGGGSVSSFRFANEKHQGSLTKAISHHEHVGSSVSTSRQTKPHAHSIYPSPDGKFVYSADLGTDKVEIYALDSATGALASAGSAKVPAGGGPRHMAFSKDGSKLYVLNELTLTVSEFSRNAATGALKLERTEAVMNDQLEKMSASEIQLSADGKYLYAACRDLTGKGRDKMAVLITESLEVIQNYPAGVSIPRHFGISPCGKWLLVAGQKSNRVVVLARDVMTGLLAKTAHSVELDSPMWILFP